MIRSLAEVQLTDPSLTSAARAGICGRAIAACDAYPPRGGPGGLAPVLAAEAQNAYLHLCLAEANTPQMVYGAGPGGGPAHFQPDIAGESRCAKARRVQTAWASWASYEPDYPPPPRPPSTADRITDDPMLVIEPGAKSEHRLQRWGNGADTPDDAQKIDSFQTGPNRTLYYVAGAGALALVIAVMVSR